MFEFEGIASGHCETGSHKFNRCSGSCVFGAFSKIMSVQSFSQIVGDPAIQGFIRASNQVDDPILIRIQQFTLSFDFLPDSGGTSYTFFRYARSWFFTASSPVRSSLICDVIQNSGPSRSFTVLSSPISFQHFSLRLKRFFEINDTGYRCSDGQTYRYNYPLKVWINSEDRKNYPNL